MLARDVRQHVARFFRRARLYVFAPFDEQLVREIVKNGAASLQITDHIEAQAGSFDCGCCRRNPTRSSLEELAGVSIGEGDRVHAVILQLKEDRMLADDVQQRLVWESLFVRRSEE